jgi:outer membrane protein insertion porin family
VRQLLQAVAIAMALLFTVPANAQTPEGRIQNIVVQGNQRIENETIESYLALHQGDAFDPALIDRSLKNLYATGLFDDVSIQRSGGSLVVKVVENPIINRIAFEGNKRIDTKTLQSEVQLQPRVVYTRQRVQDAVERILELYRRSGRYSAKVDPQIIKLDQNRVDLVFEINEGPLTKVGAITFIGNQSFSDTTLRGVIQTKEAAWYRILSTDDTYDPDRLAFDQELLRRFYEARGFADFAVVSAVAELTPDGKEFFITFTLDEGPRYKFGKIDIQSEVKDVSPATMKNLLTMKEGQVFNADEVENTVQALTSELSRRGYAFVQVNPVEQKNRDALTVDVAFDIRQGPRVYIERIEITGNVRTRDPVIRRQFQLAEGDAFNSALLRKAQQRLRDLNYFETVDVTTTQGSAPDKAIVHVAVAEKSTGELSFGAGYSTTDGVLGDITLHERNFLGRGLDAQISLTLSQKRQLGQISYTDPYFLNRDVAAGFDLFISQTDQQSQSSYDQNSTGGVLRANYPLTENFRHGVNYTLRDDSIHNVDNNASVFIFDDEGDRVTSAVGQTFTYDKRDTKFLPSSGYYAKLDQQVAGLGGDNRFIKHELQADYYYSIVPDVVLSLGFNGGSIIGFGGEDVHLTNRFFIGGDNFPGFEYAGLGPRDSNSDDALGGNSYYIANAEVRFPLGLPKEFRIFGSTFVYVGTLTGIDVSGPTLLDDSSPRASAGVGLSWLSPLGPLSVKLAQPIVDQNYDKTEIFLLSFGTRF